MSNQLNSCMLLPICNTNISFGRCFFDLVVNCCPDLMPGRYGNHEPLEHKLTNNDIEELLTTCWDGDLIWKARNVYRLEGCWLGNKYGNNHAILSIYGKHKNGHERHLYDLYQALTNQHRSDIGYIHILSKFEFDSNRKYYEEIVAPFNTIFTKHSLKYYIPNLAWGMFFGKLYVDLIGWEKLSSAPAYLIEEWGDGVYVQVSEKIQDTYENYEAFDRRRTEIKHHLGREFFFDPELSFDQYQAPEFQFDVHTQ